MPIHNYQVMGIAFKSSFDLYISHHYAINSAIKNPNLFQ